MSSLPSLLTDLARVIRRLRGPTGLSQERFASSIKLHRTKIGNLERGKGNPTLKTLHKVADGLGVSVARLFALTSEASDDPAGGTPVTDPPGGDRVPVASAHRRRPALEPKAAGTKGGRGKRREPQKRRRSPPSRSNR